MDPNLSLYLSPGAYNWLWGYFIPIGLLMLVWAGLSPRKARQVTGMVTTAITLSILGYWAVGFAFHMGGAFPVTQDPALQGLNQMLPLVRGDPGWGILGLSGFFLSSESLTPTAFGLFLAYLPLITTSVLLVTLALAHTRRGVMVAAGLLTGTVIVPVAACWMWGSGWLSHLGMTLELGYGFVDFGGSGLLLWLPGMIVLPILLLQPRSAASPDRLAPPRTYAPLMANVGALLLGLGWLGWQLSGPFHVAGAVLDWQRTAINVLLGMAGAALTSQFYAWLMLGTPEALLASQGLGAGWGAVLACAPFVPPWAAVSVGAVSGLLFPLVHYALSTGLRIRDAGAAVAMGLTSGPVGLLAVAVLADGRWGQGWNGVGVPAEGRTLGPGVAGLFVGAGEGQLWAQLTGLVALGVWGLLWGTVLGFLANPGRIKHVLSHTSNPRVARVVSSDAADPSAALVTQPEGDGVMIVDEQESVPSNGAELAIPECEPEPEPETGSLYGSDELQG
jgi:ammonium transporter, Amt family